MSHSIAGAFKPNRNDNLCTPRILVECLGPYFEDWCNGHNTYARHVTIWLPFDKEYSEFAIFFRKLNCNVIYSHIDYGQDFLGIVSDDPDECIEPYTPREPYDIIISNPPFSRKLDVFKRCNELGKPWVMLSNVMSLNYMEIGNYFADNPVQMLIPDKRVSFDGNPSSFCSGYYCKDFLNSDLEFCHLPHCNSGKDFIPSRMLGT